MCKEKVLQVKRDIFTGLVFCSELGDNQMLVVLQWFSVWNIGHLLGL